MNKPKPRIRFVQSWGQYNVGDVIEPLSRCIADQYLLTGCCEEVLPEPEPEPVPVKRKRGRPRKVVRDGAD